MLHRLLNEPGTGWFRTALPFQLAAAVFAGSVNPVLVRPRHFRSELVLQFPVNRKIRRRIYTGEKVKVVAAVWGTELIQFLAALAVLLQDELKKRINCTMMIGRKG